MLSNSSLQDGKYKVITKQKQQLKRPFSTRQQHKLANSYLCQQTNTSKNKKYHNNQDNYDCKKNRTINTSTNRKNSGFISQQKNKSLNFQIQGNSRKFSANLQKSPEAGYRAYNLVKRQKDKKHSKKEKHPFIRSFIIKDHSEQASNQIAYNYDSEHNKFISMLNQCINKTSLNFYSQNCKLPKNNHNIVSGEAKQINLDSNAYKIKHLSESFNNIKVKQSLQNSSKQAPRKIYSAQTKYKKKSNACHEKRRQTTNLNSQKKIEQAENQPTYMQFLTISPCKMQFQHYTNITQYNISNKNFPLFNEQTHNTVQNQQTEKPIFSNLVGSKGNYNKYLWSLKQKKLKQFAKGRGSPELAKKNGVNSLVNSSNLNNTKQMRGSNAKISMSCNQHRSLNGEIKKQNRQSLAQIGFCGKESPQQDVKIEQLNIFTNVRMHTPKKRKISMHSLSPECIKQKNHQKNLQNDKISLLVPEVGKNAGFKATDDEEQGNSCYLRTVNF